MKGKAERRIVLLALAGFLAVTVLCLLNWREFVIRYHLMRLQRSPEYFATLLEEPEESTDREALRRYVVTPEGSQDRQSVV